MKALTVEPGTAGSIKLEEFSNPVSTPDSVLVQTLAIGICGTDMEIASGNYGWSPEGHKRLIIGHESLGKVLQAPLESGFKKDDLVVGIVRRPDPVPCPACAVGQWDMCRNGLYTERGIKQRDGFGCELYTIDPNYLVKIDPSLGTLGVLLEPTTVVAKAWEQVEKIGHRAYWSPHKVVITGAGPIGLLAALLGVQKGWDVHVIDVVKSGLKPDLVHELGATYHVGSLSEVAKDADVVIECTGVDQLIFDAIEYIGSYGIVCLTGVSALGTQLDLDAGLISRTIVLDNQAIVGSVNANRTHYETGAEALAKADKNWLSKIINRKVFIDNWQEAFKHDINDVKVIIEFLK